LAERGKFRRWRISAGVAQLAERLPSKEVKVKGKVSKASFDNERIDDLVCPNCGSDTFSVEERESVMGAYCDCGYGISFFELFNGGTRLVYVAPGEGVWCYPLQSHPGPGFKKAGEPTSTSV